MAHRPVVADLIAWLKLQSAPDVPTTAVYTECITAALDDVESRLDNTFALSRGEDLTEAVTNTYPQRVRTAVLMDAARIAKRSTSPEGVAGLSDIGAVVHIMGRDPDIERLILRYRKMGGFA